MRSLLAPELMVALADAILIPPHPPILPNSIEKVRGRQSMEPKCNKTITSN